jgi:hypothetical protein
MIELHIVFAVDNSVGHVTLHDALLSNLFRILL